MVMIGSLATALLVSAPTPVELKPGVTYRGPQTLRVSSEAITFELGSGWVGQLPPNADAMLIRHRTELALIAASARRATRAEARKTLSNPIPLDAGMVLHPAGKVKTKGDTLTATYRAGDYKGFALARVRRDGRVVAFVGLVPAGAFKTLTSAIVRLGRSVRFAARLGSAPYRGGKGGGRLRASSASCSGTTAGREPIKSSTGAEIYS